MIIRLSIAVCLFLRAAAAFALPFATGDVSRPECVDAMKLARTMYYSTAQRLFAPLTIPTDLHSTLVLGASELDISGGDALTSTEDFEKLPHDRRHVYWAKETNGGLRVVVHEIIMNWQGDWYRLYLLDPAVKKEDFLNSVRSDTAESLYQPVISETWRPPLVFKHHQLKAKWFIYVDTVLIVKRWG
jgi:hypothetical protein